MNIMQINTEMEMQYTNNVSSCKVLKLATVLSINHRTAVNLPNATAKKVS